MRRAPWLAIALVTNATLALIACGSRTGFLDDGELFPAPEDASVDHRTQPRPDGAPDTSILPDALPTIDVNPRVDVSRNDCPDADATLVYLISDDNRLFSFYPPSLALAPIGVIACPSRSPGSTPYSMAVNRKGTAFVVFQSGELFRVSTATAACTRTPFLPGQQGFTTFGMGFVSNTGGADETLYVAEGHTSAGGTGAPSRGIGAIDTTTFKLSFVGPFTPPQERVEFTGTGDGRLFGFSPSTTGSAVIQVDKGTGNVLASDPVPAGGADQAFAFAFWGGDFWIFTGTGATKVYRYRPADKTTVLMTTFPTQIVGAGVSTCAPQ